MIKKREGVMMKENDTHLDFIHKHMKDGRLPNMIIILDTHSDTFSKELQATGGLTGTSTILTLLDLVRKYVGDPILEEM